MDTPPKSSRSFKSASQAEGEGNSRPDPQQPASASAAHPALASGGPSEWDGLGFPVPELTPPVGRPIAMRITILRKAGQSRNIVTGSTYYSTMTVIPKPILEVAGMAVGDSVMIMAWADGTVVMRKAGEGG